VPSITLWAGLSCNAKREHHCCRPVPRELSHLPDPPVPGRQGHQQAARFHGLPALQLQMASVQNAVQTSLAAQKRARAEVLFTPSRVQRGHVYFALKKCCTFARVLATLHTLMYILH
jgi:hypothetical protein